MGLHRRDLSRRFAQFGAIGLCAHPNSLPFASKAGNPPGFQVELGQALARELGVALRLDWIITQYQMRSAGCDILFDVIADREAQGETASRSQNPIIARALRLPCLWAARLTSFKSLDENTKVGVQVASFAAMIIGQRHVPTSTFGFEVDSLEALANHEIDAAAVTPTAASYFNLTHPDKAFRSWRSTRTRRTSTGMSPLEWSARTKSARGNRADLERLRADGTIDRIYRRYGVTCNRRNSSSPVKNSEAGPGVLAKSVISCVLGFRIRTLHGSFNGEIRSRGEP